VNATDWIGWASSAILVLTLAQQVKKQWQSDSTEGVSRWLFAGQLVASIGFAIYSILLKNWVFVVTNVLLVGNAVLGGLIILRSRRRKQRASSAELDEKPVQGARTA